MLPAPRPRLLVFDLDGTLIDSSADLCHSVNAALAHVDRHALPQQVIAGYIGDGAATLMRRALAHSADERTAPVDFEGAFQFFLDHYRIHLLDNTRAYDGVHEALREIAESPAAPLMAVLTNKPVRPSRAICDALGLTPFFFENFGGNSFETKKPNPQGLLRLIDLANARLSEPLRPEEVVMIGDSSVDVQTARSAGVRCLGCSYGLSPESMRAAAPDVMVDSPTEWPAALNLRR